MRKGTVVELTGNLAMWAAKISLQHQLPMASLILGAALAHETTIWTYDAYFRKLPGVEYFDNHSFSWL